MKPALILAALLLVAGCTIAPSPWTITAGSATLIVLDEADLTDKYQALGGTKDNIAGFTICALTPDELTEIFVRTDMLNATVMAHEWRHKKECDEGKESWHD
ncbi:hypothetical protein LCGC14_1564430 [marine sediment metagenome]|uniref:Lipoprotein n=1 Tax=marine sediment metagenome TaxID=412755 RepID=A0A0F9LM35_9ZZZZ